MTGGGAARVRTGHIAAMWAAWAVALATCLPLLAAVLGSFRGPTGSGYAWWWGTFRGWEILARTLGFASLAALVAVAAGAMIAATAARMSGRVSPLLLAASCIPVVLPSSLLGTAWIMALGRQGWITQSLPQVLGGRRWNIYDFPVAAAATGLRYSGVAGVILLPAIRRRLAMAPIDRVFVPGPAKRLVHLILRPAIPPLLLAWAIVLILCANDHVLPGMFLVSTYGVQVLVQYSALLDPGGASALATPVMLVMIAIVLLVGRTSWPVIGPGTAPDIPTSGRSLAGIAITALVLLLCVGVPVAALAGRSGSLAAVREAWGAWEPERWRTLYLAGIAGGLTALIAAAPAAAWATHGSAVAAAMPLVNLVAPPSLIALGVLAIFERQPLRDIRDSDVPLIVGYVCRLAPVAMLAMIAGWSRLPRHGLDAARAHGLSTSQIGLRLIVPVYGPTVFAAAALCAVLVATELELSLMLAPPGASTLGVRLYTMIHTAPDSLVSAAAVGVGAAVLGLAAIGAGAFVLINRNRS